METAFKITHHNDTNKEFLVSSSNFEFSSKSLIIASIVELISNLARLPAMNDFLAIPLTILSSIKSKDLTLKSDDFFVESLEDFDVVLAVGMDTFDELFYWGDVILSKSQKSDPRTPKYGF